MGLAGAKQYAIRDNAGTTATNLQRAHKLSKEQELCLAGIGIGKNLLVDVALVQAASKRRIGHDERIAALIIILF